MTKTTKTETEPVPISLNEELKKAEQKLKSAQAKAMETLKSAEERIHKIEQETETFCGVVLSQEDLVEALKLSLTTGEPVKIPYRIYLK